ncbi:transglutaminase domain-containing protein [Methanobrevibacter sp. DSM 116169]|uniref:transglutaminase domain-containing protein n=1 Tax=Methanobrevibacter sp. DSM 116169 TaxID=3242727 RepID=UPI0038FC3C97
MKKIALSVLLLCLIFSTMGAISALDDSDYSNLNYQSESTDLEIDNNNIITQHENYGNSNEYNYYGLNEDVESYEVLSSEINTTLNTSDVDLFFKNGTGFTATLTDKNGNALANQTIVFTINGNSYNRETDATGTAKLSINLNPGTYTITSEFKGEGNYAVSKATNTVLVKETIFGDDVNKLYLGDTPYTASFLNGQGNPLANTNVTFNINGVFYTRTTNSDGVAKLNINLRPDKYILTAIHPDTGYETSNMVVVNPTILAEDLTKVHLDSNGFFAKILDKYGNPIANSYVEFNINGVLYKRDTNSEGIARLNINLDPNNYIISVINHHDGLQLGYNVKILAQASTNIKAENISVAAGESANLGAYLYDQLGNLLTDQTVHLTVNNQLYTLTTNSNGFATYNINLAAGTYDVNWEFKGIDKYLASKLTSKLTVESKPFSNIQGNDTLIFHLNGEGFAVLVTDKAGNAIANASVYFTINGIEYLRYADENGIAKININLDPNNYIIDYKFKDENYATSEGSNNLTVIKKNIDPTISSETTNIGQGTGEQFKVNLNVDGVNLVNQVIAIYINGVTYNRVSDAYGNAYLTINLGQGTYNITYSFAGNSKLKGVNGSKVIAVVKLVETMIVNHGSTIFYQGETSQYQVILLDNNGKPLADKDIIFTINGVDYTRTTDSNGIGSININLATGFYNVAYKFEQSGGYLFSSGSTAIEVIARPDTLNTNANGYWVFGRDMYNVNLATMKANGIGNIFLNFAAISSHGKANVESWIASAASYGINVHIWMQAFYESGWIYPVDIDGNVNTDLLNKKIAEAVSYANINGVAGIHLDYLRYPGGANKYPSATQVISNFVRDLTTQVKAVNSNLILSAAIMPETTSNPSVYGQDVLTLSKYLDVIVPMIYKGNYNAGTSWIASTTNWFVQNSGGAKVWVGLQGYVSDDDLTLLSAAELSNDAQIALNAGAAGSIIFRFGVSNIINFNNLDDSSASGGENVGETVSLNDITSAAASLKTFIESNGILPTHISVGGKDISVSQFLYLMSNAIYNYNSASTFTIIEVSNNGASTGDVLNELLYSADFLVTANDCVNYIASNKVAPTNLNSAIGLIQYNTLVYTFAKVLNFANNNFVLPNYVYASNLLDHYTYTVTMLPSVADSGYQYIYYTSTWLNYCPHCNYYGSLLVNPKNTPEGELTCGYCDADYCGVSGLEKDGSKSTILTKVSFEGSNETGSSGDSISLNNIIAAAVYLKNYYSANEALPDSVTINDKLYSVAQVLYLMSVATSNINKGDFSNIAVLNVAVAPNPTGVLLNTHLTKDQYVDVFTRVASFIVSNGYAPNYASSAVGNIIYYELVDSVSRILSYYDENGGLPSQVSIVYSGGSSATIKALAESLTAGLTSEREIATVLFNYVRDNINYQSYYDTIKGAEGALSSGGANCCDQTHLLIALLRESGLTARYVHGNCYFSSGWIGHVWAEINIDGSWVTADTTSSRNSLGVINNWNTGSVVIKGRYEILPF